MTSILILINILFIFILAQVLSNLTLYGSPILVLIFIFGLLGEKFNFNFEKFLNYFLKLGILLGIYLSFKSDENICPNFNEPNYDLSRSQQKLMNYSLYTELSNILNYQTKKIEKEIRKKNQKKSDTLSITKQLTNLFSINEENSMADISLIYKTPLGSDNTSLNNSENELFSEDHCRYECFKIIESQFNSKIDTYIDEIVDLGIRDFVMPWMRNLIWDENKFTSIFKLVKLNINFKKINFILKRTEIKFLIENLKKKLRNFDLVKFISKDLITIFSEHYFDVNRCSK